MINRELKIRKKKESTAGKKKDEKKNSKDNTGEYWLYDAPD